MWLDGVRNETEVKNSEVYLRWTDFDEEAAVLVRDLEDFGPREPVDPQFVFINHETAGADPKHDVDTVQILGATSRNNKNKQIKGFIDAQHGL